jgi:hypothetical protein
MSGPSPDAALHSHLDGMIASPIAALSAADPHGRAALLLVESLIHALVDKKILSRGEAIDIIDIATEVEAELAAASDGDDQMAMTLLAPLAKTFRLELGD